MTEQQELDLKVHEALNKLSDNNKFTRLSALKSLSPLLTSHAASVPSVPDILLKTLVKCIGTDSSESCREHAAHLLNNLLIQKEIHPEVVESIISVLESRLSPKVEVSEEVRLVLVRILSALIMHHSLPEKAFLSHINAIVSILNHTVSDSAPEIKREACATIRRVAKKLATSFHLQSESLTSSLVEALKHSQSRVKIAALEALGDVLISNHCARLEDIMPVLAHLLNDGNPQVRLAVVRSISPVLLKYLATEPRASSLLPLLLISLGDGIKEVDDDAERAWKMLGQTYYKHETEQGTQFDLDKFGGSTAELGCYRVLSQLWSCIWSYIERLAEDWRPEMRLQGAKLLHAIVLYGKQHMHKYVEDILRIVMHEMEDEDKDVRHWADRTATLVGAVYQSQAVDSLLQILPCENNFPALRALNSTLRGVLNLPMETLDKLLELLAVPGVCHTVKGKEQEEILGISEQVGTSHNVGKGAFILLSLAGLSENEEVQEMALGQLQQITKTTDNDQLLRDVIRLLPEHHDQWSATSPSFLVFCRALDLLGFGSATFSDIIWPKLGRCLDIKCTPEMQLKASGVLNTVIKRMPGLRCPVKDPLLKSLEWRAGKTASILRTAALSCLVAAVEKEWITYEEIESEIWPLVLTLLEDDQTPTRVLTCQLVALLVGRCTITEDILRKLTSAVLGRLDDVSEEVRCRAAQLAAKICSVAESPDLLQQVRHKMGVYLNDPAEKTRAAVEEALSKISVAS